MKVLVLRILSKLYCRLFRGNFTIYFQCHIPFQR